MIVHARMTREVSKHLTGSTRFWIVTPRVGTSGISGLNTLVSGAYIEMYPGEGETQRDFVGLEDPPLLQPDTPGRAFTLTEDELGAIGPGTPVNYRGVQVGQVEGYALDANGRHVNVYAFVRAPYDALVHDDTRFWDASAIDVSAGPQGVRVRLNSLQQLVTGAIGFDTPLPPGAPLPHAIGRPGHRAAGAPARSCPRTARVGTRGGRRQGIPPVRQPGDRLAQSQRPAPDCTPCASMNRPPACRPAPRYSCAAWRSAMSRRRS